AKSKNVRAATVRPDFIFPKLKLVVLVDGCFWHGCPKHSNLPQNNRAFWRKKLARNRARDRLVNRTLRRRGWRVVRLWQHELKNEARCLRRINAI
ncbi:MAG TPA: very short patch repair endonuclease, partial [Verrucomicrobiae bacterium]|nr:very short patch repair endonuclease [Verrucomicrobiae bacterium]